MLGAGFSASDVARLPHSNLLSGRSPDLVAADSAEFRLGPKEDEATHFSTAIQAKLNQSNATACAGSPDESPPTPDPSSYNAAAMEPYVRDFRRKTESGFTEDAKDRLDSRRRATNEKVAATAIGRASAHQHHAVVRIAEEFGLKEKQRMAFFIFGNAWMATNGSPNPNAFRLHVSGGAGSGKSYVLKAIVALIECPALKGIAQPGGSLTVALQGKEAGSVGGSTVHSVCDANHCKKKGTVDGTAGQTELSAKKAAGCAQLKDGAIAMEEIFMISCNLLGCMQKAAAAVRPFTANPPRPVSYASPSATSIRCDHYFRPSSALTSVAQLHPYQTLVTTASFNQCVPPSSFLFSLSSSRSSSLLVLSPTHTVRHTLRS